MTFGLLIEYNMRIIFFWKIILKIWNKDYCQILFEKVKIEHLSGSIVENFIRFVFIAYQVEGYWNILKLRCRPLAFTLNKAKTNKGLQLVSLLYLWHDFRRKTFHLLYFINWSNFVIWVTLLREILKNVCIVITC